uniref:Uncharacterized protein n=1 Tax=Anguilla anguilla TaxID=7936 RepID=A0A0E9WKI2_ANGAN
MVKPSSLLLLLPPLRSNLRRRGTDTLFSNMHALPRLTCGEFWVSKLDL